MLLNIEKSVSIAMCETTTEDQLTEKRSVAPVLSLNRCEEDRHNRRKVDRKLLSARPGRCK